ncbi:MAG: 23S rRNA (uracil(1939)-C(5))-methyltransferase RlmD [Candidatus Komeilibacteria bacterium]|nr:23S rRNA (uracil(1939)-C(5))-methyltransferase RlmD [Candidatus Komeilibacteria bacterium]
MAKLPSQFELDVVRLVPSGEGMGYHGNRPVFVFGSLPGEKIIVRPVKVSRQRSKAAIVEVIKASPERIASREDHYISCSPWQIMSYDQQLMHKQELATVAFRSFGLATPAITAAPEVFNYRNKMEFSLVGEPGQLSLAWHKRWRHSEFELIDGCVLARPLLNDVANLIKDALQDQMVAKEQIKSLVVRYSYSQNKCLAALYVTDSDFPKIDIKDDRLAGWLIIYSDPQFSDIRTTAILHKQGDDYLTEKIGETDLRYFYDSFFQINPPSFNNLLQYLQGHIGRGNKLVDLYSGVGTFALALASAWKAVTAVEFNATAVMIAEENAKINGITNVSLIGGAAEKQPLPEIIADTDVLLVDPPRSGLHPKVAEVVATTGPKKLIYVSCNPVTQATDWQILKNNYRLKEWQLFDFYPQTPHVESVIIAERF